jgi:hypothetical protein
MQGNNKYSGIITILKIVGVIAGLYISFIFIRKSDPNINAYEHNYKICLKDYASEYSGVIIKNFFSRGTYMSQLSNNKIFVCYCRDKMFKMYYKGDSLIEWELLEVGDSIYKPAGTFNAYIYKQANPDSVIFIECDYDCEINLRGQIEAPELKIKSVTRFKNNTVLKKLTLNWKFDRKHEKYIKGFRIAKENLDESIDTSILLKPDTRFYDDSIFPIPEKLDVFNGKYVYFQYKLVVVIEGIKDKESYPPTIVPYIDWKKVKK